MGCCGSGWDTPADARLVFETDGTVSFYDGSPGATLFSSPPDHGPVEEFVDGAVLDHTENNLTVRVKTGLTYHFPKPNRGEEEVLVESFRDLCGNAWHFIRRHGALQEMTDSTGRRIGVVSRDGRIERMLLHHPGEVHPRVLVRYAYNAAGDLTTVYDPLDAPDRFLYNNHCLTQHTDRNGLSFSYEYDQHTTQGRCFHSVGDNGLYDYHFAYSALLNETTITDSLGYTTIIQYDVRHLPIKEIDALGGVTEFEYDEVGRTSAVLDPSGNRTEYEYDDRGNLLQLTRPDSQTIVTEFDATDKAVHITDPNGTIWQQAWDFRGLLSRQESPLGAESRYEYDARGQLIGFINPLGARTIFAYDTYGNLTHLTNALGHTTEFVYDALGNVVVKTDPLGQRTHYAYDLKGRLTQAVLPSGATIACAYDAEDHLIRYQDENSAVTRLEYCGLGEIKRRLQPDGHVVEYHYDTEEQLIAVINQRHEWYELKRDPLGRIIEEIDYWGQARKYVYTAAGFLSESVDPLGRRIRYETDPLGHILHKALFDADGTQTGTESFSYDANGNLTAAENADSRMARQFDPTGRLVEEKQGDTFILRNQYDPNGNRVGRQVQLAAPNGLFTSAVHFSYDLLDQAISVQIGATNPISIQRDALGQITLERLSPALHRGRAYNPDGYLIRQQVSHHGGELFSIAYEYDHSGNLVGKRDSQYGTDRYTYTSLGQLVSHLNPQQELQHYLNDPTGDRLHTRISETAVQTEQGSETLWVRGGGYKGTYYRFDRVGNLVERKASHYDCVFEWNGNQRLNKSTANGQVTIYRYDPLGRRVAKTTGTKQTLFYWDSDALVMDWLSDTMGPPMPQMRAWVYYPGTFEPLAMLHGVGDLGGKNGERAAEAFFFQNDPNGCPTRLVNMAGKTIWAVQDSILGHDGRLLTNHVGNPVRLQGQYVDEETGLHYNRHRYYDPDTGQYVTQDPLGLEAGVNIYTFAPNTESWIDPLGLTCQSRLRGRTLEVLKPDPLAGKSTWQTLVTIPPGATRRKLVPVPGGATRGFEYKWNDGTHTWRVRIHDADPSAPLGSNAHSDWISRVQRGSQYADDMGNFHPPGIQNPASPFHNPTAINDTHIPFKERQRFPR